MSVRFSIVLISSDGPPVVIAELSLFRPWPGTRTRVSRGNDTSVVVPFASRWASMVVSERSPATTSWRWYMLPVPARLSDPTSRKFVLPGGAAAGRSWSSPSARVTLVIWESK